MIFALPIANGQLCMHFGHTEKFAIVNVDAESKSITSRNDVDAPPHQPGLLPVWLADRNVNVVIAGGLGQHAQNLLRENNIEIIIGAPSDTPENLIAAYLEGSLQSGQNACDH